MEDDNIKKSNAFSAIKNWWLALTKEQWELTVYFPGPTKLLPDGTRIDSKEPKVYDITKIIKMSSMHMIFIDTDNVRTEIKLIDPVGYTLRKIY